MVYMYRAVRTFVNKTALTMLVSMVQSLFGELAARRTRPLQTCKREDIRICFSVKVS